MGYDLDKLYEGPRSERRNKRRKVNRVLNILIVLVIVLIVFFGGKLIFGDKKVEETVSSENQKPEDGGSTPAETEAEKPEDKETPSTDTEEKPVEEPIEEEETLEPESSEDAVVTDGDAESNISKSIVNPAWQPIGTEQSEPHVISYDEGSADREEMERAASYATAIDRSDMIVWWLGRNGDNSIHATVSSKTSKQVFKVYLEWVPNEGWKPVKLEELKENDSPAYKKSNQDTDEEDDD
ncbi:YrrS family protein [Fredinandcohnia sp. 179-A 10B2 NHS]|uniref:YrrS family protein n=1 Tax=Fredinandcohnia sp. 179-A 10B2 NHS TaxID=3235176 RepID=UPI00399F6F3D